MKLGMIIFTVIFLVTSFSSIEAHAGKVPKRLPEKRGPASFSQGFKTVSKKCNFYVEPKKNSQKMFEVEAGRKIWFTAIDSQWLIAKTKNQAKEVYLHSSCVN